MNRNKVAAGALFAIAINFPSSAVAATAAEAVLECRQVIAAARKVCIARVDCEGARNEVDELAAFLCRCLQRTSGSGPAPPGLDFKANARVFACCAGNAIIRTTGICAKRDASQQR